jgi:ankyrin repeat protein
MYFKHVFALCMVALLGVSSLLAAADAPIVDAAKNRDSATLRSLLKQRGVDVNAASADGSTALHWASHWGDVDSVKLLLAAGANAKAANRYGVTPLHEAVVITSLPIVEALLNAGASPNATYGAGETPLMAAARTGNVPIVKVLLDRGSTADAIEEYRGQTAIMYAAAENHPDVIKLLIDRGANVNQRSAVLNLKDSVRVSGGGVFMDRPNGGLTPLFFAAREGSIEAAEALIAAGADVNAKEDQYGFTPLLTAAYNGRYDFAAMLLNHGASPSDGSLYLAVELRNMATYSNRPNPPDVDTTMDALALIKVLLDKGADPNQAVNLKPPPIQAQGTVTIPAGGTALNRAVRSTDIVTIKLLLERGADPNMPIKDGTTPIMQAASGAAARGEEEEVVDKADQADPLEAIKLFVDAGADVNQVNEQGNTAVHLAAQRANDRVIEYLVSKGAKLDILNKGNRTALDLARQSKTTTELITKLGGIAGPPPAVAPAGGAPPAR